MFNSFEDHRRRPNGSESCNDGQLQLKEDDSVKIFGRFATSAVVAPEYPGTSEYSYGFGFVAS